MRLEKHAIGRMSRVGIIAALLSILVAAGCSDENRLISPARRSPPPSIPSLTVAELLAAPDSLRVGDTTLTTEIDLYRDWFADPDSGTGLIAIVHLNGSPRGTLPPSISAVYIWVVNGSEIWSKTMTDFGIDVTRSDSSHAFRAEDGPRWSTGILVDAVIGVRTSPTNVSLVLLKDVPIHMTI